MGFFDWIGDSSLGCSGVSAILHRDAAAAAADA